MTIRTEDKTFKELTNIRLPATSRLRMFSILRDWNNERFLNIFRTFLIRNEIKDSDEFYYTYNIEADDWWDNISYKFYNTPDLWWAICYVNDVVNPYEELEEGKAIKILRDTYLHYLLTDISKIAEL